MTTTVGRAPKLSDVVVRLLNTGAVLTGRSTISLTGIDLIHLELQVLLSSVETLRERQGQMPSLSSHLVQPMLPHTTTAGGSTMRGPAVAATTTAPATAMPYPADEFAEGVQEPDPVSVLKDLPPDADVARGLAHLVLTLVELLRQVVEQQALRRVEGGGLSDAEIERVGVALQSLEDQMARLRDVFGIEEDELDVNLNLLGLS